MSGCIRCKYFNNSVINTFKEDTPRSCKNGYDDVFEKWWRDNENTHANKSINNPECFEATELDILLDKAIRMLKTARKLRRIRL